MVMMISMVVAVGGQASGLRFEVQSGMVRGPLLFKN